MPDDKLLNPPIPEPDLDEACEFLANFHSSGPLHLAKMAPDGTPRFKTFPEFNRAEVRTWIRGAVEASNIYFSVNRLGPSVRNKKSTREDVVEAVALHVDVDDTQALERILAFQPCPTAIVFSGGGYQAFWLLQSPTIDKDRAERCSAAIAKLLGGDKCHNVDRIMRVPGTVNFPDQRKREKGRVPMLAKVVEADWTRRYSLDDFPEDEESPSTGPIGSVAVVPAVLDTLPNAVAKPTRVLIETGDDPERPRGGNTPRYKSRSEAVFHVACDLVRAGCSDEIIAGVLTNPAYSISMSVLEKKASTRYALKQARSARAAVESGWPDVDRGGLPKPSMRNAVVALRRLELQFGQNLFTHRKVINGRILDEQQGEVSDDVCVTLRGYIIDQFGFDPRAENVRDAVTQLCLEHTFHPVREMLDTLHWDDLPRIDHWMTNYLGAADTELTSAIGRIMLIAAVRRAREPGVKFDTIVVLEGKQGSGKSTALQILAGEGNHSDNEILTLDTKSQMEAMEGVWIYEIGEISGLRKAEVERVKAFASRQVDRARMAYGRFSERRARQAIFVGTTNEDKYLRDATGNRRFLPVKTGVIELEALRRDREQLLAEAAHREAAGESITLPEELWAAAAIEQDERLEEDPWEESLAKFRGKAFGDEVRVFTNELLGVALGVPIESQNSGHSKRLKAVMLSLGWQPAKFKVAGRTLRGFRRPKDAEHVDDPVLF